MDIIVASDGRKLSAPLKHLNQNFLKYILSVNSQQTKFFTIYIFCLFTKPGKKLSIKKILMQKTFGRYQWKKIIFNFFCYLELITIFKFFNIQNIGYLFRAILNLQLRDWSSGGKLDDIGQTYLKEMKKFKTKTKTYYK